MDVEEVLGGAPDKHKIDVVAQNTLGGLAVTWIIEAKTKASFADFDFTRIILNNVYAVFCSKRDSA